MGKSVRNSKIVPINWIDDEERWILVPGTVRKAHRTRTKEIIYTKGRCSFTMGVPKSIIDFIYRSVKQLKLTDRPLIFSRGTVRTSRGVVKNEVSIRELDWGVGTLITIPRVLKYGEMITLSLLSISYSVRLMELVVLHGLLQIAFPRKKTTFYYNLAARILTKGWGQLDDEHSFDDAR